jgi:hypothetical protein
MAKWERNGTLMAGQYETNKQEQKNAMEQKQQEEVKKEEKKEEKAKKSNKKQITLQQSNGSVQTIDFYPAPRHHASASVTRNAQKATAMTKSADKHVLPDSAKEDAFTNTRFVPVPSGGIAALADSMWPDDLEDDDKMDDHIFTLMTLNRDIIRDDTSVPGPHTLIRVPIL